MYVGSKNYSKAIISCKGNYMQRPNNHVLSSIRMYGLNSNGKLGELVLGDMVLNTSKLTKDMVDHYNNYCENISLIALPHHGSKNDWFKDILTLFDYCEIWIASSGFSNRFSHPSNNVITDIETIGKKFFPCNEFVA